MLVDNGDDTVTDRVTGLMWQRTATITFYNRAQAQIRCQGLRAAGHDDWRVPSTIELVSIVDYDRFKSSIDAKAFPDSPLDVRNDRAPLGLFGTTTVAGTPLAGWLVNFSFGEISLDTTAGDRGVYIRCVRGPRAPASDTSAGRYDVSVAGVARDTKTGLTWQRSTSATRIRLIEAKAYCAGGTGLPGTGWRLPTIKELMTLADFAKPNRRVDETVFTLPMDIGGSFSVLWSATSLVGTPPSFQYASGIWSFYSAPGYNNYVDAQGAALASFVRCVR